MKLDRIRIQHFQCIKDTGEIPVDQKLTILVGANESGKSAIMKALWYFNQGNNFDQQDLSTLSGVTDRLYSGQLKQSEVEIVTVWVILDEADHTQLGIRYDPGKQQTIKIWKTFDSEYHVDSPLPTVVRPRTRPQELIESLTDLGSKVQRIYRGRVKRKYSTDYYVFLERYEEENPRDNLILFPEWASGTWDDLAQGDWIQVTRFAEDPYGRNTRALNAGLAVEVNGIIGALSQLIDAAHSQRLTAVGREALQSLRLAVDEIPKQHPLREYVDTSTIDEIAKRLDPETQPPEKPATILERIGGILPEFIYLPHIPEVSDDISVRTLGGSPSVESDALLNDLVNVAGLQPRAILEEDQEIRERILNDKAATLTNRLRDYWYNPDLSFRFTRKGQKLGLWIVSGRSMDPPSRRSRGLSSYISLFAKLVEISTMKNVVTLLDDPGINLHPVAQRKLLSLLESQPFQIVVSTHLPFMIDPDHIERVRVLTRTPEGTCLEHDWANARESLMPVWGSILGAYFGTSWLIVEGKNDSLSLLRVSKACAAVGRQHLPESVPIVPGGGDQLVDMVRELLSRGISVTVLTDGDQNGRRIQKVVRKFPSFDPRKALSLADVGLGLTDPETEDLFGNQQDMQNARDPDESKQFSFSPTTLERFEKVFAEVNKSLV